jgi:hypothetical protein
LNLKAAGGSGRPPTQALVQQQRQQRQEQDAAEVATPLGGVDGKIFEAALREREEAERVALPPGPLSAGTVAAVRLFLARNGGSAPCSQVGSIFKVKKSQLQESDTILRGTDQNSQFEVSWTDVGGDEQ